MKYKPKIKWVLGLDDNGNTTTEGLVIGLTPGAIGWSRFRKPDKWSWEKAFIIAIGRAMKAQRTGKISPPPKILKGAVKRMNQELGHKYGVMTIEINGRPTEYEYMWVDHI